MTTELSKTLQNLITEFLGRKENLNISALARIAGLTPVTLRRIATGEVLKPSFETAMALLGALKYPNVRDFIQKFYPEVFAKHWEKADESELIGRDVVSELLEQPIRFRVFNLATLTNGTTQEEVTKEFGELGREALSWLEKAGLVFKHTNGSITASKQAGYITSSARDVLGQIKIAAENYKEDRLGTEKAGLAFLTENLSLAALAKIQELEREFLGKVAELKNDAANRGEFPFVLGYLRNVELSEETLQARSKK